VIPRARIDVWLTLGIAGYLTGLFVEETFGRNEYRHYTYRKHEEVCKADAEWYACKIDDSSTSAFL